MLNAWPPFEQALKTFRDAARNAGRNPDTLQVVIRANVRPDAPAGDQRRPLTGSSAQIAEDLARLRGLGVSHVFWDMNFSGTSVADQLRLLEHLRKAAG